MDNEDKKKGFFSKLLGGLAKTRDALSLGLESIFLGHEIIDDDFYDELEEMLILDDIGVIATSDIIDNLRDRVREDNIRDPIKCREILKESIIERMGNDSNAYDFESRKSVILMVGVNGVGKTTTVGKIASQLKTSGKKVLVAAADTFRAGASNQLRVWAQRAGVDIISGQEGSDPASVVFDAINAAKARDIDVLIVDTAGRLHNRKNLMEELGKIDRIINREYPDIYRETLLVVDATTGQNALEQARQFKDTANITGIVITKLDGTAKGGIVVAIQSELGIPVKYIGIGEHVEDLRKFDSEDFVNALFTTDMDTEGKE